MIVNRWRYRSFILRNAARGMRSRSAGSRELSVQLSLVRVLTADGRRVVKALGAA